MNNQRPYSPPRAPRPRPEAADGRTRVQKPPKAAAPRPARGGRLLPGTVVGTMVMNLLKAMFVVMCLVLMGGSVAAVQMVQYVVEATGDDNNILDLEVYETKQTSFFHAYNPNNPNARAEGDYIPYQELSGDENRIWVPLSEFPQNLRNAVIATEDQEFLTHHGINFRRTAYALANELLGLEDRQFGASTITQQLVKNITKEDEVADADGDMSAGYLRKLREMFRAWGLENRYSKDQIMEAYLNTIGLSERIAGAEAGARKYFGKAVSELTLAECATIAGITQAPSRYSPFQNPENCIDRRNDVIAMMYNEGYITIEQRDEVWAMSDLGLAPREEVAQNEAGMSTTGTFSWITDKVYKDVISDMVEQGIRPSEAAARDYLYNGGLNVYLTADLRVQAAVDDLLVDGYGEGGFFMDEEKFPGYADRLTVTEDRLNSAGQKVGERLVMPQCAVAIVNYKGELIATGGGIGEKEGSLTFNRSIDGARQTGSTMKAIAAYPLGIENGIITYSKMIMESGLRPRDPYNPTRDAEGNIINDWPSNAHRDGYRDILMPVAAGVAESTNTIAARVGMMVGVEPMFEFVTDTLEVSSMVDPNDLDLGPMVLGSQTEGISPYEMAGAVAMLGGDDETDYGVHNTLHSYTKVTDNKGNIIMQPELTPVQAIDPQTGYIMNRMLWNVLHGTNLGVSPTAYGMAPEGEMDSVGKTGTTSDDKDRWFLGLTPYYVTAVWWGYDVPNQDYHNFLQRGGHGWSPNARTNIPVNVWKSLMETVQAELPYKEFPPMPEGVQTLQYCTSSGDLYQEGCPGAATGYYAGFKVPGPCRGHEGEAAPEAAPAA